MEDIRPLTPQEAEEIRKWKEEKHQRDQEVEKRLVDTTMASAEEWLGKQDNTRFLKTA